MKGLKSFQDSKMVKEYRTIFIREFTKNLILNSKKFSKEEVLPYHPVTTEFQSLEKPEVSIEAGKKAHEIHTEFKRMAVEITRENPAKPQPFIAPIPRNPAIESITPAPHPLPPGFTLGKLNPLIADRTITLIECPGPGKLILVKAAGRANPTNISLSEEEIRKVIASFSATSKIPLIEGIFKAVIGNLLITAVISDYVGSRFIINKYTPYSILEK